MKMSIVTPALHVLGGLVGGGIVSLAIAHSIASRATPPTAGASAREAPVRAASADQNAWLEWRVRRLEDATTAAVASADRDRVSAAPDRAAAPAPPGYSEAEAAVERERHLREWNDSIHAHDREPLDGAWADSTARSLSAEMASFSEGSQFSVADVDCKTTTCKAAVRWPTYKAALETYPQLVNHMYQANCTRTILLPPPPDLNAPYQATVLFDCEHWRAGQLAQAQ